VAKWLDIRDVVSCQYTDFSFLLAVYFKLCCVFLLLLINSFTLLTTYYYFDLWCKLWLCSLASSLAVDNWQATEYTYVI